MNDSQYAVKPLGIFGVVAGQGEFEQLRDELRRLVGVVPESERPAIAGYLRAGAIVFAIMSYSWDVLGGIPAAQLTRGQPLEPGAVGGAFVVPGGLGIQTDGAFYWRQDAADYVECYGVSLPEDFLRHGRALDWQARAMTRDDILAVDQYLMKHAHRLRPRDNRA